MLFTSVLFILFSIANANLDFLSDEFIEEINSKQNLWTSGRNFMQNISEDDIKYLTGLKIGDENVLPEKFYESEEATLPTSFDARTAWPNCKSISDIGNQGACGSCWAISAVEVMSDRYCIHSDEQKKFQFSLQDLLTCCESCGSCEGGFFTSAFAYWSRVGIVSGGHYNSEKGCRPYSIPPTGKSHRSINSSKVVATPECKKECISAYPISYENDKKYGSDSYRLKGENAMKIEIYKNGPIVSSMIVYKDFYNYRNGIYTHVSGTYEALHAVKVFGWGEENGVKFWHAANSWGTGWGDKGFFKILRGKNECDVEVMPSAAALPFNL